MHTGTVRKKIYASIMHKVKEIIKHDVLPHDFHNVFGTNLVSFGFGQLR